MVEFPIVAGDVPEAATPLASLANPTAELLIANGQKVAVFESSTGGLLAAALQSVPGASKYTTFNAVTYSRRNTVLALPGLRLDFRKPTTAAEYEASKNEWTESIAKQMHGLVPEATWCVAESGACGPTFNFEGLTAGFTSICVSGPVTRGVFVRSATADREQNMRTFVKAALELLACCIREASGVEAIDSNSSCLEASDDRYGGITIAARSGVAVPIFAQELGHRIVEWKEAKKRGLWLKIPAECANLIHAAIQLGFQFHHAKPEYVQMTQWLLDTPSPLPMYAFTQIGVGGVVVNSRGEVLMVQERVSPAEQYQGSWKLPGGLADPGESFSETAMREVQEETGVQCLLDGVVSLRHSHKFRFGVSDMYVLVRLRATAEELKIDEHEIAAAEWMHPDRIKSLVEPDRTKPYKDKVSATNWEMISNALFGKLISGVEIPTSRGPTMFYMA